MDPYTPRTRTGGRKKNLTLSAKEYTKARVIARLLANTFTDIYVIDHRYYRICEAEQTATR